jgi:hypothetical protein
MSESFNPLKADGPFEFLKQDAEYESEEYDFGLITNEFALTNLETDLMLPFDKTISSSHQHILRLQMKALPNANEQLQHHWAEGLQIEPKLVVKFVAASRMFQPIRNAANKIRTFLSASEKAEVPPFGPTLPSLYTSSNNTTQPQCVLGSAATSVGTKGKEREELVENSTEGFSMMQSQAPTKRSRQLSSSEESPPKRGKRNTGADPGIPVPGIRCTHPHCSVKWDKLHRWRRHEKEVCFPPKNYRCPKCGRNFKKRPNAEKHVRDKHDGDDMETRLGEILEATDFLDFHKVCPFVIEGKRCPTQLQLWEESMGHAERHWLDIANRKLKFVEDWHLEDQCPDGHPDPKDIWGKSSELRSRRRGDDDDNSSNGNSHHRNASSSQGRVPSAGGGQAYNGESSNS